MSDDGLRLLAARVEALPDALAATLRAPMPDLSALRRARRVVTTGVGGSEGPARVCAALLRERTGRCARFAPLSRLACEDDPLDDTALVVFSQGVSANARIALGRREIRAMALVTAADRGALDARGGRPDLAVIRHAPTEEDGLLVRVIGPAAATLAAIRLCDALVGEETPALAAVPSAVRDALGRPWAALDPARPVALVGCDLGMDLLHGQRWKWLEALRRSDASVWDALGFAHGPLQLTAERPTNLALFTPARPREARLFARMESLLLGDGHTVLRVPATLPGALGFFEHDAGWSAALLATLRAHPRDLLRWPAQGRDGALYDLDAPIEG